MKTTLIPLIALGLALGGCNAPLPAGETGGIDPSQFTTDIAKHQDLIGYSFFDGKLVIPKSAQATAFSPYATSVLTVMTGAGKHVRRGEPIVKLTIPGADDAATAAKNGVSAAKADYSATKGDSSDAVRAAQQALADAQAAEKVARDTPAGGNQPDIESATQDRIAAQAALRQAQQDLRRTLQPNKEAIRQASASLSDARAGTAKGVVRAPISGTIVTLQAQPGMQVSPQQALAAIVNFDAVSVQGLVPAELKDFVIKGSHVIVAMNGSNSDPLDGIVIEVHVAPPIEGQNGAGYLAVIRFLTPKAMVQTGGSVKRIGVKTGSVKNALVVAAGAILTKAGKSTVEVQSGGKWIETPVEIGITDGALTEIKSGLSEGAVVRIATKPQDSPKP